MLNTLKISVEDLPIAMYKESMNSWSQAYTNAHSNFTYIGKSIDILRANIEEAVSKGDYTLAGYFHRELMFSIKEFYKLSSELSELPRIMPKDPSQDERSYNGLLA